jgi:hypothetical protein
VNYLLRCLRRASWEHISKEENRVGPVEDAVVSELEGVDAPAALAAAVLLLARRLDEGPGDDVTVRLARELRQSMLEVRAQTSSGVSAVEEFLAGISEVR